MVHRFFRGDRVLISSFRATVLRKVKEMDGGIRTGLLVDRVKPCNPLGWMRGVFPLPTLKRVGADTLHQHVQLAHPSLTRKCRKEGIPIYVWVVDQESEMRGLIRWGINGIFTNRPDVLDKVIQEEIGKV